MLDGALSFSDGWTLVEDQLLPANRESGSLFTTSNGYVGVRPGPREPFGTNDVLVCGVFESRPYAHPEVSFGVPRDYQTIVRVTDPWRVSITVDGVSLAPETGTWLEHRRTLDLRSGCVATVGTWRSPNTTTVEVRSRRLASLVDPHLAWYELAVEPDRPAAVDLVVETGANTGDQTFPDEPEPLSRAHGRVLRPVAILDEPPVAGLVHATALSQHAVACVSTLDGADEQSVEPDRARRVVTAVAGPGDPLVVTQRAAFTDGPVRDAEAILDVSRAAATSVHDAGFDAAVARQQAVLDDFWDVARVDIDGHADIEEAIRFCTYQAFQAVAHNPGRAAPAKGLTGQRYEGHQLWDHEIYLGQLLDLVAPDAARRILTFRCATLPGARARAAQLSHRGAQFPWRTIDGTEASASLPAGAAQYHVTADVAWAVDHHVAATGDETFLHEHGLPVLVETARFWRSLGRFDRLGRFHIEAVTGPDEYTVLVDNNLYTNLMAARNLESAACRLDTLERRDPGAFARLADELELGPDERDEWRRAARSIVVPFDDELLIHGQDDSFLARPRWGLGATPREQFPLHLHRHLLNLYRHQVLKQADVVLAHVLVPDRFTVEQRRRNFDYYEPLTSHDSSLSEPIHAIDAAATGRLDLGWRYTAATAMTDLDNRHGRLPEGLHIAAAAGAWLAIVRGFGGLVIDSGGPPVVRAVLPPGASRLRFGVRLQDAAIEVEATAAGTSCRLLHGDETVIVVGDQTMRLTADEPVQCTS